MIVKITPNNEKVKQKLEKLIQTNNKWFYKTLRLGARFIKVSDDPYIIHYRVKAINAFSASSIIGRQMKDPLLVAVYQTLENKDFGISKEEVEVVLCDN